MRFPSLYFALEALVSPLNALFHVLFFYPLFRAFEVLLAVAALYFFKTLSLTFQMVKTWAFGKQFLGLLSYVVSLVDSLVEAPALSLVGLGVLGLEAHLLVLQEVLEGLASAAQVIVGLGSLHLSGGDDRGRPHLYRNSRQGAGNRRVHEKRLW